MLRLKSHVIDALDVAGGQLTALYPEKPIYDIPGYPKINAGELVEQLLHQAHPFAPVYHLGQQVTGLQPSLGGWLVTTNTGTQIQARCVVIAAGAGAFGPNRPPINGIETFEGRSVFYMVRRRQDFAGRRVVIAGGGDSAVDWAISLAEVATSVTVVHRRAKFRAAPESVRQMDALAASGRIELVVPFQLTGLLAKPEGSPPGLLDAVIVADLDGATRILPADALLSLFGLSMSLGPLLEWKLNIAHGHIVVDPRTMATNHPGVFAIGDVATYPDKLKLILSGFHEAAMAAHAIYPLARPGDALHFQYSTTQGLPSSSQGEGSQASQSAHRPVQTLLEAHKR